MGSVHTHVVNYKVDLDGMLDDSTRFKMSLLILGIIAVGGTANSVQTIDLVQEDGTLNAGLLGYL